ncbi:MAG: transcription termination/antitermination protein NusG [Spirochaetes bacterium]|nr:transcription termination/antitermination protein NusG [Spirochaetota bacterium]
MKGWYIAHTLSSQEKRAFNVIKKKIESGEFKDIVYDVKVPVEQIVEMHNSKKVSKERKFFPGYVLIEMMMSNENMNIIRKVPGITNFLGAKVGQLPKPLPVSDVKEILNKTEKIVTEGEKTSSKIFVSIDEKVKIIDGPFKGFQGVVEEIHPEKGRIKVQVEIFGRPTPVDLDFLQIERV